MGRIAATLGLMALLPSAAAAQGLEGLVTADDAAGWEAVGRLDIDGKGFCTGALIGEALVLTAAHCLFDRDTGAPVDAARLEFRAGLRDGRALASRPVRRAMAHPAYAFDPAVGAAHSRHDLALLELAQPIRAAEIAPFATAPATHPGAEVSVVSYAADRAEIPAIERACAVLGEEGGVLVLSCDVDYGASGAPIFATEAGVARIVSVVSAKGELDGARVAIGAPLSQPLEELRAAFAAQGPATLPQVRTLGPAERAETGAKFVSVGG